MAMRGLTMFISDIRNCTTQEQEQKRCESEMAHIRTKFAASSKMDAYDRKKYMWKILYMYMLGYEIDFGHMEAVNLVTTHTYSEKSCGYVACSLLLSEHQDLLRLIIQAIKNDLAGKNEVFQSLALVCVANVGGQEFAEALAPDVQKLLVAGASRSFVRKKAALCLLRMFRKYPDIMAAESWAPRVLNLLEDKHLGVVTSVLSLLLGLVARDRNGYEEAVPKAIRLLGKLVLAKECDKDYTYYKTPSPWVQVKLLRLLQHFPPPKDKQLRERLDEVIMNILTRTEVTKSVNKNNADHGILFEAVNLVINMAVSTGSTADDEIKTTSVGLLGKFIGVREPNIRYLGLETMARMARIPGTLAVIKKHQASIQYSLKDGDISIRKRALDLLYTMCDESNAREIVDELVKYLETAEYAMREELVLKIAILAERFSPEGDKKWYVNTVLKLIAIAGAHVSDDIWYRVVQVITNNDQLHAYSANAVLNALKDAGAHECAVKVGGYVLGEFGHLLKDEGVAAATIFDTLHRRFPTASASTRALLLSSYMKLLNMFPELRSYVLPVFGVNAESLDSELQQRAVEYSTYASFPNKTLVMDVWEMMPAFPVRESMLEKKVKNRGIEQSDNGPADGSDSDADSDSSEEEIVKPTKAKRQVDDDILGLNASPVAAKASSPVFNQPPAAAASADDDPWGAPSSAFGGVQAAPPPPQDMQKLTALYTSMQGVLYEHDSLQVGLKMSIDAGSQCKLILYYGNKDANMPLSKLSVTYNGNSSKLKMQAKPEVVDTVAPRAQTPHYFLWSCFQPFDEAPVVTFAYTMKGAAYSIDLRLPLLCTKYMQPPADPQPDGTAFVAQWKATGNEAVDVFRAAQPIEIDRVRSSLSQMNFLLIDNLDKNPAANVVCAGALHTATKNASGAYVIMPVLARVETNAAGQGFRVTIRSGHKLVTEAVRVAFQRVFASPVPPASE